MSSKFSHKVSYIAEQLLIEIKETVFLAAWGQRDKLCLLKMIIFGCVP